jgi:sporulation protein YlmC with PRC-barrel domain
MRMSDLVQARVLDPAGTEIGRVHDVRLVQDGPVLGTWGAALRVEGLIVGTQRVGNYLGYERSSLRGPWLVAAVVKWLHRKSAYVAWDDVESVEDHVVRIRRRKSELPPVPALS